MDADPRTLRILRAAMELAERDGYEAVRLRELARRAGVALGTVYKRFASKEEILAGVLQLQVDQLRAQLLEAPIPGRTPEERLERFFAQATEALAARPRLAAATLRTVASGEPELAEHVTRYHDQVIAILLGVAGWDEPPAMPADEQRARAELLQAVWFASLVGWTGGLHGPERVVEQVGRAVRLLAAARGPA